MNALAEVLRSGTLVVVTAVVLLAGCTTDPEAKVEPPQTTAASTSTSVVGSPNCVDSESTRLTLEIEPGESAAGGTLFVQWPTDIRGVALFLEDAEQLWLLLVGRTQAEASTVPFETVGTYPPALGQSPGNGFVILPAAIEQGCYLLCDDNVGCAQVYISGEND